MIRPVYLEFSGLLSYAETTCVDFAALSKNGLFGIFGRTGSGKTAVLDAVTLALYGRVPRLGGKAVSTLLNPSCDSIYVSFHFEVNCETYRATRTLYFGKLAGRSKYLLSRLTDSGEFPMADKERDVTGGVEALFGFNYADFTRAALLPQGKFAEFLRQRGSERKEMLERILMLERFGNELNDRVRELKKERESRFNRTDARLSEFDGVDEERQKELANAAEALAQAVKKAEESESAASRAYADANRSFEDTLALAACEGELKAQEADKEAAENARDRLALFEKARSVYDVYTAARTARGSLESLFKKTREAEKAFAEKKSSFEEYDAEYAKRRAFLCAKAGEAEGRVSTLTALFGTARLLDEKRAEHECAYSEEKASRARLDELTASLKALEKERNATDDELNSERDACPPETPGERLSAIMAGKIVQDEEAKAREDLEKPVTAERDEAEKLSKAKAECECKKAERDSAATAYEDVSDRYDALAVQNSAAFLSARLTDGVPCPVCGSVHHPAPSTSAAVDVAALKAARDDKKSLYDAASVAYTKSAAAMAAATERATASAESARLARDKLAEVCSRLAAARSESGVIDFSAELEALTAAAKKRESALGRIALLLEKSGETSKKLDALKSSAAEASSENAAAHGRAMSLKDGAMSLAAVLSDANAKPVPGEKAENTLSKAASAAQKEAERASEEVRAADEERASLSKELGVLSDELTALSGVLAQAKDSAKQAKDALDSALSRLDFASVTVYENALLSEDEAAECADVVKRFSDRRAELENEAARLRAALKGARTSEEELKAAEEALRSSQSEKTAALTALGDGRAKLVSMETLLARKRELAAQREREAHELSLVRQLEQVLRNRALVDFIAREYLMAITDTASSCLFDLTNGAFGLTLSDDGEYMVIEHQNCGILRPTDTLSGGETFLVSLSLALSLSQKSGLEGKPLGVLFLDEGFGTLDEAALDSVLFALEALCAKGLTVGVISHIDALKDFITSYVSVTKTDGGSKLVVVSS